VSTLFVIIKSSNYKINVLSHKIYIRITQRHVNVQYHVSSFITYMLCDTKAQAKTDNGLSQICN